MAADPVVEKIETPAAIPAPAAAPADGGPPASAPPVASPAEPAAPIEAKVEPSRTPTLLEKFDTEAEAKAASEAAKVAEAAAKTKPADKPAEAAKPADKAADAPKPDAAKPAEAKPAEAEKPAELTPVEYKYTLPEGLSMDDALKGKTHAAFDAFRANPAEGVQKLIDLHAEIEQRRAEQTVRNQFDVFNKTKETWEKDWLADPEIGGAGHRTALGAIARVRDIGVTSAKEGSPQYDADWKQFEQFLAITGAGSHPAFGRLMHNLSRYIDEPQAKDLPTDIKPTKTNGKAPRGSIYNQDSLAKMDAK